MGDPPPTEMRVSMAVSRSTKAVATSMSAMGPCCDIWEKVPACRSPSRVSRSLMREVLVARDWPVTMKALEVGDGRALRRCVWTQRGP